MTDIMNTAVTNSLKVYLKGDSTLSSGYTANTGKSLTTASSNSGLSGFVLGNVFKIFDPITGLFELRTVGVTSATGTLAFEPEPLNNSYNIGSVITTWNTIPVSVTFGGNALGTVAISNNGNVGSKGLRT